MNDRQQALDQALKQIEKQFGKGSIMRLGEQTDRVVSTIPTGSLALDIALGVGGYPRGRVIEIYGLKVPVKQRLPCMRLRKSRHRADRLPLLMRNTHLTRFMPKSSVSTLMNCSCPSRIRANRRWKLQKRSSAAAQWTLLSLTLLLRLCRERKLKEKWAIPMSASRHG